MVASFSEAIGESGECLGRQWNSSVIVRTAQSTVNQTRNSKLAAKDELLDIESLLPQYAVQSCKIQKSCDEKWYEELNDYMKKLVNKPANKKTKLQLNLKKVIRIDKTPCFKNSVAKNGYSKQLLGVIDPIGSFVMQLNEEYVENIEKLLKLGFMQRIKYEKKKREYEQALILTFSNLCKLIQNRRDAENNRRTQRDGGEEGR
eukprot:TRINITY_DN6842_c0_g1_i6.p1 TRINITY_DN6842_c0_g1~~TRINITY_DN6842_c0_g1_i6.p1  ORF type:complete len:203 (-),score=28.44 TRINITY_DN6842_c0_g1_i6:220-828(-)